MGAAGSAAPSPAAAASAGPGAAFARVTAPSARRDTSPSVRPRRATPLSPTGLAIGYSTSPSRRASEAANSCQSSRGSVERRR